MMKFGVIFLFLMVLFGCNSSKETVNYGINDQMPACNVRRVPELTIIRASNTFGGTYLIENGDTTAIKDYTFYLEDDTLNLFNAFEPVRVPDTMRETFTQGITYMRTALYSDSTFSPTTILRGIGPMYKPVQQQIDQILATFRVVEPPRDSVVLIFYHNIKLKEY